MSVAPRPQTDDAAPETGEADGWALLDALRRRLDDQGAQVRKTQTQVAQLAESIGALVEVQRRRSRWLNLNSFVAYLIFTLLCGGAFFFLYQSRARVLVGARDKAISERDATTHRAEVADAAAAARQAADTKAWDAYQLLEAGKRQDAAKLVAQLGGAPLSRLEREVLAAREKQAETKEIEAALDAAKASYRAGHYDELVAPLEQALALEASAPRAAELHYLLGMAAWKTGAYASAATHLQEAVDGDVASDDARYYLAASLDKAGQWGKARAEYDRFATAHPQLGLAVFAQRRSAMLSRMPAVGPAAVTTRPATTRPATGGGSGSSAASPGK